MRKLILTLLLAGTAASPVLAQDRQWTPGGRDRNNSSAQSDDSQSSRQRAERPQRAERAERPERSESTERAWRPQRRMIEETTTSSTVEAPRRRPFGGQSGSTTTATTGATPDRSFTDRALERHRANGGTVTETPRDRPATRDGIRRDRDRWTSHWRSDSRYDWRSHRDRHRSHYRRGRYYDPYGWGYRRFSIGFNLWPSYYGSHYWLDDPWMYRLPPAYGPYRWVRYWDDALLVDVYSGRVVDVVHNFFW